MDHEGRLGSWSELYVMLGGSSAALIGLLFVASSLHLREIANDDVYRLRAQYTTLILVGTLIEATIILTPQPIHFVGAELLITTVWITSLPISLLRKAAAIRRRRPLGGFSVRRAVFFLAATIAGIIGAIAILADVNWGLQLVTASYTGCLIAVIWNAWKIMLGIGQSERPHGHQHKKE